MAQPRKMQPNLGLGPSPMSAPARRYLFVLVIPPETNTPLVHYYALPQEQLQDQQSEAGTRFSSRDDQGPARSLKFFHSDSADPTSLITRDRYTAGSPPELNVCHRKNWQAALLCTSGGRDMQSFRIERGCWCLSASGCLKNQGPARCRLLLACSDVSVAAQTKDGRVGS